MNSFMHCGVDLYANSLLTHLSSLFFQYLCFFCGTKVAKLGEKFGKLHILAFAENDFLLLCIN